MTVGSVWRPEGGEADWVLSGGSLEAGDPLATAVIISLFTDRQAAADDVIPDGSDNRRGWWGDLGEDRPIGSKLWLRRRAKQTGETLALVRSDIEQALAWMLDDGVAGRVDVVANWIRTGVLGVEVFIWRRDPDAASDAPVQLRFDVFWE